MLASRRLLKIDALGRLQHTLSARNYESTRWDRHGSSSCAAGAPNHAHRCYPLGNTDPSVPPVSPFRSAPRSGSERTAAIESITLGALNPRGLRDGPSPSIRGLTSK